MVTGREDPEERNSDRMYGRTGTRPDPDPTERTIESMLREVSGLRQYVDGQLGIRDERFRGIDRATELLNETVNRVPTDLQKAVEQIREVTDGKFDAVDQQFDALKERAAKVEDLQATALAAAFAAAKEAAAKQDEANQKSIDKSERGFNESLNKLESATKQSDGALSDKIDDLKTTVARIDATQFGMLEKLAGKGEAVADRRAGVNATAVIIGIVGTLVGILLGIAVFLIANHP